jgi:murein DD-endopeptidase MepM/ murein hydrolase activator NlpD
MKKKRWQRPLIISMLLLTLLFFDSTSYAWAQEGSSAQSLDGNRMGLYLKISAVTQVPWELLAAIDQFERNCRQARRDLSDPKGLIGIGVNPNIWVGPLNPNKADTDPFSIMLFEGLGRDGNGDGKADPNDPDDVLYSMASYIASYGTNESSEKEALWEYYHRDQSVSVILELNQLYDHFQTLDLNAHGFPVPLRSNYDYLSTWGASRGWGGRRIHEGTDIFANYGTPVRATSYGIVELKGWNKFGGWRIGIRDANNLYHYFGHLSGFEKGIHVGSIVKPGDVIGYVGSTGYGPPGTSGKFPPHLHYGIYKYNGKTEYSFDPYPSLRRWERQAILERRKKKN